MKKIILIFILFVLGNMSFAENRPEEVSLMQLIVTPEKFHGKLVQVIGVSRLEFEGNGIWVSKEHYKYRVVKNSLWIDLDLKAIRASMEELKKFNGKYVVMEGVFNKDNLGHMGLSSGALERVSRFDLWEREWKQ